MKLLLSLFLIFSLMGCSSKRDKTVFLAILARNKAHTLPKYLECIDSLDYNKKAITVYINTNNNKDETEDLLLDWMEKNRSSYKEIIFESHSMEELLQDQTLPHQWEPRRLKALGLIRNKSLKLAIDSKADFYFVADCDNFVTPETLKLLVEKNLPIVAPLLITIPGPITASNFWGDIDENGYYKDHPFYYQILYYAIRGTFKVPVVHCTYLIRSDYLSKLGYIDGSDQYEFMVFSKMARDQGIDQYICNELDFGTQYFDSGAIDLETERVIFKYLMETGKRAQIHETDDEIVVELDGGKKLIVNRLTGERSIVNIDERETASCADGQ